MAADRPPLVSVVIPTHDRPEALPRAVASVLAQTMRDLEVVVVDDGSDPPVALEPDPRIRVERHGANRGLAASLNTGVRAAQGRWIAQLDDDDLLLPRMLERSLDALATTVLPPPVMVVSGIEEVDSLGQVVHRHFPPTRERGAHWSLEPPDAGFAYQVRNTMVAERQLLIDIGLFDERLRTSVRNDLFLRLNPVCSILALHEPTYQRLRHGGNHLSDDRQTKHESLLYLERKHRHLYRSHRTGYAEFLRSDARHLVVLRRWGPSLRRYAHAALLSPGPTGIEVARTAVRSLRRRVGARRRGSRGPSEDAPPAVS